MTNSVQCWLVCVAVIASFPGLQERGEKPVAPMQVIVSESVAKTVRPLLDLRLQSFQECGRPGSPSKCTDGDAFERQNVRFHELNRLFQASIHKKGPVADEALVVL